MSGTTRYVTLLLYEMARHRAMAKIAETAEIRDGHLVGCDCGAMYALVLYDGGVYRVHGTELLSY